MSERGGRAGAGDFYVGGEPAAPRGIARFLRPRLVALLGTAAVLAAVIVASQAPFPAKVFEWGNARTFVGWVKADPVPVLRVRRPGAAPERDAWSSWILVGAGKRGARAEVAASDGALVRLEGTLVYRDGRTMVEVVPGSVEPVGIVTAETAGSPPPAAPESLGRHTLVGEIVDSKCFLGVMAPGSTKPHRACATRCIAGGIPPVFLVRDRAGRGAYLLLLDAAGKPVNDRVLDRVAEPLEITGEVRRDGALTMLLADPSGYRRLADSDAG